jgi:hypothetical protein
MYTYQELSNFLVSDTAFYETGFRDASKIENMRTDESKASANEIDDKVHTYLDMDE